MDNTLTEIAISRINDIVDGYNIEYRINKGEYINHIRIEFSIHDDYPTLLWLMAFEVPESITNQGIGTSLLNEILISAKKNGIKQIHLEAFPQGLNQTGYAMVQLVNWYQKFGFIIDPCIDMDYYIDNSNIELEYEDSTGNWAVPMYIDL